jgi:hypothetical protein
MWIFFYAERQKIQGSWTYDWFSLKAEQLKCANYSHSLTTHRQALVSRQEIIGKTDIN